MCEKWEEYKQWAMENMINYADDDLKREEMTWDEQERKTQREDNQISFSGWSKREEEKKREIERERCKSQSSSTASQFSRRRTRRSSYFFFFLVRLSL